MNAPKLTIEQKFKVIRMFPIIAQWTDEDFEQMASVLQYLYEERRAPAAPPVPSGDVVSECCDAASSALHEHACHCDYCHQRMLAALRHGFKRLRGTVNEIDPGERVDDAVRYAIHRLLGKED